MVAYTIRPGYNSNYANNDPKPWQIIVEAVNSITYKELIRLYEGSVGVSGEQIYPLDMAKAMVERRDCAITICEEEQYIMLLASGTGEVRRMKECMRRAFILCVLRRAFKQGIDVNVSSG